ncbi:MAG: class I tRNA ligase family protein, partial [Lachnospiraceae bacterium]|nr:class I tRNA ligase family protein [Lachnospiraceae bacterium]
IRWYFYINSAPWLPNRFHDKAVIEGQRKFMGTLWNTYAFFVLYANIDNFDATKYSLEYDKLPVMDRWLLSRLMTTVSEVDDDLWNYRIPEAARALDSFVDEMSNWYVRRGRERFWAKGMEQDKINAYMTLYTALVTIAKTAAPMIPFMSEAIYRNLVCNIDASAPESVHLCDFPTVEKSWIDASLEKNMEEVLDIVVLGRACRNASNIKQRQPMSEMYVKNDVTLNEFYKEIIEDELNVKEVTFREDVSEFTGYTFKPQLRTLGKRFGKQINAVKEALLALDSAKAMAELNATGSVTVSVDGVDEQIAKDDLLIEAKKVDGYVSDSDGKITVVMNTTLTPELIEEGYVREVISKVQTMRKEADFEVMDHIVLAISGSDKLDAICAANEAEIRRVVLADKLVCGSAAEGTVAGYTKDWNINGEDVTVTVAKV